jgi:DNA-binding NarL/FixJ family response regulator
MVGEHATASPSASSAESDLSTRLSRRELEVLELATLGLSNVEIARRLSVTVHAVKFHLSSVYRKLGVSNRTEAAVLCLRAGGILESDNGRQGRMGG